MESLRTQLIRLAQARPELRPVLLPLLARQAADTAGTAYSKAYKSVVAALKQLEIQVSKHQKDFQASGQKDWGYVGDMNKITSELKDVLSFISGRG